MFDPERGDRLLELWVRRLVWPFPWLLVVPLLAWLATGLAWILTAVLWAFAAWAVVVGPFLGPQLVTRVWAEAVLLARRVRGLVVTQPNSRGVTEANVAFLVRRDAQLAGLALRDRVQELEWAEVRQQLQTHGLRSVVDQRVSPLGYAAGPAPSAATVVAPAELQPLLGGTLLTTAPWWLKLGAGLRARWLTAALAVVGVGVALGLFARGEVLEAERDQARTERDVAAENLTVARAANQTLVARLGAAEQGLRALGAALAERDLRAEARVRADATQQTTEAARRARRNQQESHRDTSRRTADQAGPGAADPELDHSLRELAQPAGAPTPGERPAVPGVPGASTPAAAPGELPAGP